MFEATSVLVSKAIGFIVGVMMGLTSFFFIGQQTNNINFERSVLGTTTAIVAENIIKTDIKQTQEEPTNVDKEKEKKQAQTQREINQLERLVKETNILTKQFSELVQKQKKEIPASMVIHAGELNQKIRPAIVNIFCTTKTDGALNPISGSGVIISKEGIILTNAHIGQYFLLKNYQTENFISCVMRQGDGEQRTFNLDLIYVSPLWIKLHAKDISKQNPTGTGQFDYALLSIGNPVDGSEKPKTFPFIPMETDEKHLVGESGSVLLASYPAEFLSSSFLERELSLISSVGEIQSIFTFTDESPTIDLLEIDGSILSQKGSSGGAVVNQETGKFVGMITTSTDEKTTGERKLRALSSSYVSRMFKKETNVSLADVLVGNIESFKRAFAEQMIPSLIKQLEIELDK